MLKNKVNEYRKRLEISQRKLAEKVGISRVSLSKIETEKAIPNLKTASDIANALGVCIYQIFDLNGKETYCCDKEHYRSSN